MTWWCGFFQSWLDYAYIEIHRQNIMWKLGIESFNYEH